MVNGITRIKNTRDEWGTINKIVYDLIEKKKKRDNCEHRCDFDTLICNRDLH